MSRAEEYRQTRADAEALRSRLSPEALSVLQEWHERHPYECTAHDEGQYCCLDYILGDTKEEW